MTPRKYRLLAIPVRDASVGGGEKGVPDGEEHRDTDKLPQLEYRKGTCT